MTLKNDQEPQRQSSGQTPKALLKAIGTREVTEKQDELLLRLESPERLRVPWYIISEKSRLRQGWNLILVLILAYTGTIFPYRLCFIESNLNGFTDDSMAWKVIEICVDGLFYIDLCVWFFFTYRDEHGREVFDLSRIACNYLKTFFVVNLIACIPPALFGAIVDMGHGSHSQVQKITRLARFQRASRLVAQATELARVLVVVNAIKKMSCSKKLGSFFQRWRYIKVLNLVFGLLWIVHLLACGWYVIASLHDDHSLTWVARRDLMNSSSFEQWVQACYFILAVFTSVGFGDIYAVTDLEAIYASSAMIIGTVVQSVIMGEVITIVTHVDQRTIDMKAQKELLKSFTDHTNVPDYLKSELIRFLDQNRSQRHRFERENVRIMLTSNDLPREMLELLSDGLFKGELVHNNFLTVCARYRRKMPPRFPLLLALMLNERNYDQAEMVYLADDYPWTLYLVMKGTFAYVAYPTDRGGVVRPPDESNKNNSFCSMDEIRSSPSAKHKTSSSMDEIRKILHFRQATTKITQNGEYLQARRERAAARALSAKLFPYQLFGPRAYFGDLELAIAGTRARLSSARCESTNGHVLELAREDFMNFMSDFGAFAHVWRKKARRREDQRKYALWKLRAINLEKKGKLTAFAATTIQRFWRYRRSSDPDREMFIIKTIEDAGRRDEDAELTAGDGIAELGQVLTQVHIKVTSLEKNLEQKVSSIEQTQQDMQQRVASIESHMVYLTSLFAEHLGVQLPSSRVATITSASI